MSHLEYRMSEKYQSATRISFASFLLFLSSVDKLTLYEKLLYPRVAFFNFLKPFLKVTSEHFCENYAQIMEKN